MARADMTPAEYRKKMLAYGFTPVGFNGYWNLPGHLKGTSVSDQNAGSNRRNKLVYMLAAIDEHQQRYEEDQRRDKMMGQMAGHAFASITESILAGKAAHLPDFLRILPHDLAGRSFMIGEFKITVSMPPPK